ILSGTPRADRTDPERPGAASRPRPDLSPCRMESIRRKESFMSAEPEPFIHLLSPEEIRAQMPPGMKPPYDFGFIGGMGRLLASHPRIGPAMQRAFYEIMFAPGALARDEREMVAAVASVAQDCEY